MAGVEVRAAAAPAARWARRRARMAAPPVMGAEAGVGLGVAVGAGGGPPPESPGVAVCRGMGVHGVHGGGLRCLV